MTSTDQTTANCPICFAGPATPHFTLRSPYRPDIRPYQLVACRACGHSWCQGDTSPDLLGAIYGSTFHDSAQQTAGGVDGTTLNIAAPVYANAIARAAWLKRLGCRGKLLDVGAGAGYFVLAACRQGFDAEGMDISAEAARKARALGVRVVQGDFLADNRKPLRVDVVTLWDVLCGMTDPHTCITRVSEHLPDGGFCVMTIADGNSLMARLWGRYWPLMIPPVNLHFFTRDSMTRLLGAHSLELVYWRARGKRISIRFALQKLFRAIGISRFDPLVARLIPPTWSMKVNLGDIVTVVAVRRGPAE